MCGMTDGIQSKQPSTTTERLVQREMQSSFREEPSSGGNAATWNPIECGAIQTGAEASDSSILGEKKRHLEEAECKEMELRCLSPETRKFYQKHNASLKGFVPQAEVCRDKDGSLLTDKHQATER